MKHLFTSYYNDKGMYVIYNEKTANADSVIEYVIVMLEQFINTLAEESDETCLLYTSPSPRDLDVSRMPSSA